ncbi:flagellar hook-length control protein FliK [Microbacterium sp. SSW1-47]|nr:flagellar hook-length control protein FliK [Microbacterium sufflavum]
MPQLSAPVVSLARASDGDHRITLTVSPENLGPVTVRAHISGAAIRIELQAPGELGREALRAILADLRRDLAVAAPQATLSLASSSDGPGSSTPQGPSAGGQGTTGGQGAAGGQGTDRQPAAARPLPSTSPAPPPPVPTAPPHGGIDVYA